MTTLAENGRCPMHFRSLYYSTNMG
eukprot:IDg20598t1